MNNTNVHFCILKIQTVIESLLNTLEWESCNQLEQKKNQSFTMGLKSLTSDTSTIEINHIVAFELRRPNLHRNL